VTVPSGCSLFGLIRDGAPRVLNSETVLAEGDKVIAIGRPDCEAELREQLIGSSVEEPRGA
jgi:Trk K+ transport system NAD-binding subunit